MKVTWKYAVQKQTNVPFRWAEKLSRAHSSTCPKKNKRQHTWAKCETCEWQKCMGKGRRIIPAVAADLSFHLYMHKNTNKRQHTWAKCETCELQQGTGDKGKLWKEWGWKLGTYILHTHTNRQGIPERSVQNERGVQNYTHNTKPFWYGGKGTYIALTRCVDGEKETIIMGAAEVSFHLYMHKKTNKRQHTWAMLTLCKCTTDFHLWIPTVDKGEVKSAMMHTRTDHELVKTFTHVPEVC